MKRCNHHSKKHVSLTSVQFCVESGSLTLIPTLIPNFKILIVVVVHLLFFFFFPFMRRRCVA